MSMFATPPLPHTLSLPFSSSDPTKQTKKMNAFERDPELVNMLRQRKLYLVLDLDHTLLHSIHLNQLTQQERDMFKHPTGHPDSVKSSIHLVNGSMVTKLRPFVHTFLKEASKLFDMYICTLGTRAYAFDMLKLLDPNNEYFNDSKVIAREDCPGNNTKFLDVFLRNKESAVVILDDTKEVWKNDLNMIIPDKYHYFQYSRKHCHKDRNSKSYSVSVSDESEGTGALAQALNLLQRVHAEFFNVAGQNKDIRQLLWEMYRPQFCLAEG